MQLKLRYFSYIVCLLLCSLVVGGGCAGSTALCAKAQSYVTFEQALAVFSDAFRHQGDAVVYAMQEEECESHSRSLSDDFTFTSAADLPCFSVSGICISKEIHYSRVLESACFIARAPPALAA